MISRISTHPAPPKKRAGFHPQAPAWIGQFVGDEARSISSDGLDLTLTEGPGAALVGVEIPDAGKLDADSFQRLVADAYRAIRAIVSTLPARYPVRFWNYLPGIHRKMDDSRDRYMVFNAARYTAFSDWFGKPGESAQRLPAASGVGHDGGELAIHCLALAEPGTALENPRQISAFHYSPRYGPLPPCFSRATIIHHPTTAERLLLAAGTASIRGEASVFPGDWEKQLEETLVNLRALLAAASAHFPSPGTPGEGKGGGPPRGNLAAFSDIRVYYAIPKEAQEIERAVAKSFGPATEVQMLHAELCRPELLVEIEGLAHLPGARNQP